MCGRLACSLSPDQVHKSCVLEKDGTTINPTWKTNSSCTYKPFYNGPPTTIVPTLIAEPNNDYNLVAMKWGFTPSFNVNPQVLAHTHNCRLENVKSSNLYKECLKFKRRCVVVAEGFYEWKTVSGPDQKQPHFIYQNPDNNDNEKYLMKMAGLWTMKDTEDGQMYSCTVLTMEADKSFSWLHHRMPVILNNKQEVLSWLDYEKTPNEAAFRMISKPFNERTQKQFLLKNYQVDKKYVNKSSCNEKQCMAKIVVKRPNTLDSWLQVSKKTKRESQ